MRIWQRGQARRGAGGAAVAVGRSTIERSAGGSPNTARIEVSETSRRGWGSVSRRRHLGHIACLPPSFASKRSLCPFGQRSLNVMATMIVATAAGRFKIEINPRNRVNQSRSLPDST